MNGDIFVHKNTLPDVAHLPPKRQNELLGKYDVIYHEDCGFSTLARSANERIARNRANHFKRELSQGRKLTPDPSAYD